MRPKEKAVRPDFALLHVRLTPKGGRNALDRYENGVLYARVSAPPVDGAANKALIALLSEKLNVTKSRIVFHSGETGRDKILRIGGCDTAELELLLQTAFNEN